MINNTYAKMAQNMKRKIDNAVNTYKSYEKQSTQEGCNMQEDEEPRMDGWLSILCTYKIACIKCSVTFSRADNLSRHIKHGVRHFHIKCAKDFIGRREYDTQLVIEHISYKCRVCLKRTSYYHRIKICKNG